MMRLNQNTGTILGVAGRRRVERRGGARPGAGRPPMFKDKVKIAFDMEREDYEDLVEIADRWGESIPAVIRRALNTLLKRHRR